jgi:lysine 2,3-aminomutase
MSFIEHSAQTRAFIDRYYPTTDIQDWNDWKWQLRHQVTTVDELSRFITLTESEKTALSRADKFSFAINPYTLSLVEDHPSGAIRRTLVAVEDEFENSEGLIADPLGEDPYRPVKAIVHRYPDRVLFLATGFCAVYCRYCTRSRLVGDASQYKSEMKAWQDGFDYIRKNPEIRDVLITGGDPLTLSDEKLDFILKEIRSIPHVEFIRIGTKVPFALPQRITKELCAVLKKYHPLYLSLHVIHPREVTPESREACMRLADAGLPLGSQTVLLKGINDKVEILKSLMHELLKIRVKPYYLFHCDPVSGSGHLRTSVKKGLEMIEGLRGHTTGYAVPHYALDMAGSGGKVTLVPESIISAENRILKIKNFRDEIHHYPDGSDI